MNNFHILSNGIDITNKYTNRCNVKFTSDNTNSIIKIVEPKYINQITIKCGYNTSIFIDTGLTIHGNLTINATARYTKIYIGKNFSCGILDISYVDEENLSLNIGSDCLFGWPVNIRSSDGHTIYDLNTKEAINIPHGITIGNHVWCARDVTLLKHTYIADDCVVGMKSIVTKQFKEKNCVIAGIPAKIIKKNINWSKYNTQEYYKHDYI